MRNFLMFMVFLISGCGVQKGTEIRLKKMAVPVKTTKAQVKIVREVIKTGGTVYGIKEARIMPEVSGRLNKVLVDVGDRVKKGDVLAILEMTQSNIQLQRAQAALIAAKAQEARAEKEYNRIKELYKRGAVTAQQFDAVVAGFKAAKAGVRQAMAAVELAKRLKKEAVMQSPFDGIVIERNFDVGDIVSPAMPSLSPFKSNCVVKIAKVDRVKVVGEVSDQDLNWVKKGGVVLIKTRMWPGVVFKGEIIRVYPAANRLNRTFTVEAVVDNKDERLKVGMYVQMNIVKREKKGVAVPLSAIVRRNKKDYVFVVKGEHAHIRPVKVGIVGDTEVLIDKGVVAGDDVVTIGNVGLRDNSLVYVEAGQ